jgi:hypothetical protein
MVNVVVTETKVVTSLLLVPLLTSIEVGIAMTLVVTMALVTVETVQLDAALVVELNAAAAALVELDAGLAVELIAVALIELDAGLVVQLNVLAGVELVDVMTGLAGDETGQTVVLMAMADVTTVVCVWLSGCSGQFVTSGAQELIVTSVVV